MYTYLINVIYFNAYCRIFKITITSRVLLPSLTSLVDFDCQLPSLHCRLPVAFPSRDYNANSLYNNLVCASATPTGSELFPFPPSLSWIIFKLSGLSSMQHPIATDKNMKFPERKTNTSTPPEQGTELQLNFFQEIQPLSVRYESKSDSCSGFPSRELILGMNYFGYLGHSTYATPQFSPLLRHLHSKAPRHKIARLAS